jgi:enoyl-CoA hydratase
VAGSDTTVALSEQANSAALAKRDAATAAPHRSEGLYARSDEVMPALAHTLRRFVRDRDIGAIVLAGSERPLAARADLNEAELLSRNDFAFGARAERRDVLQAIRGAAIAGRCGMLSRGRRSFDHPTGA